MSKMAEKKTPTLSDKATEDLVVYVKLKPQSPYDSGDIKTYESNVTQKHLG